LFARAGIDMFGRQAVGIATGEHAFFVMPQQTRIHRVPTHRRHEDAQ